MGHNYKVLKHKLTKKLFQNSCYENIIVIYNNKEWIHVLRKRK